MVSSCEFADVARLPRPSDNLAIAVRRLEAGTVISLDTRSLHLNHTVLEGHRFAVLAISPGEDLRSWELPFGRALSPIAPGDYICNRAMLDALAARRVEVALPTEPNFADLVQPYRFDDRNFRPGTQVAGLPRARSFLGYSRPGGRGAGTRNYLVVLGTSSRTSSFARSLAARCADVRVPGIDGIVALAHTEGGGRDQPNNAECVLRTLAGFIVHPNVGAVLAVDYGAEAISNRALQRYMAQHNYPLTYVPHRFMTINGGFEEQLEAGERQLRLWLGHVQAERRLVSLRHLRLALQCGGSDAFSGISGNPLAAWSAREVIRAGGAANLAETDELIGAEGDVLQNVRDLETARRFLTMVERFKERVAWHGESCEGNPSGGNRFRGLYNIVLKSIGAAMKRHRDVRLDYCIDYGEPMTSGGFYFMDSPGNDLESIAGQVAAGCNAIYFVTGNGSITNFPFVPTIKIVTTTPRFELLSADMDVNAGAYQDGTSMEDLGTALFDLTLDIAGGRSSKGEAAGHSQVQIWRNWSQTDRSQLDQLRAAVAPTGSPVSTAHESSPVRHFEVLSSECGAASDQVGLVLPTSLCSGQIAKLLVDRLNKQRVGFDKGLSRFAALVHTEGCGVTGLGAQALYTRAMVSYLSHPLVRCALLLEHGCEKTHNDFMRNELAARGIDADSFGWASVQSDGGIEKVGTVVEEWFRGTLASRAPATVERATLAALRVGIAASGILPDDVALTLARLTRWLTSAGATVVLPDKGPLLDSQIYVEETFLKGRPSATLAHGATAMGTGCFVMETPTAHWTENLTGLGAAGTEMVLVHVSEHPMQGHPLVPLVQVSATPRIQEIYSDDLDLMLTGPTCKWTQALLDLLVGVGSRCHSVRAMTQENTDFQLTRGSLGVSM